MKGWFIFISVFLSSLCFGGDLKFVYEKNSKEYPLTKLKEEIKHPNLDSQEFFDLERVLKASGKKTIEEFCKSIYPPEPMPAFKEAPDSYIEEGQTEEWDRAYKACVSGHKENFKAFLDHWDCEGPSTLKNVLACIENYPVPSIEKVVVKAESLFLLDNFTATVEKYSKVPEGGDFEFHWYRRVNGGAFALPYDSDEGYSGPLTADRILLLRISNGLRSQTYSLELPEGKLPEYDPEKETETFNTKRFFP